MTTNDVEGLVDELIRHCDWYTVGCAKEDPTGEPCTSCQAAAALTAMQKELDELRRAFQQRVEDEDAIKERLSEELTAQAEAIAEARRLFKELDLWDDNVAMYPRPFEELRQQFDSWLTSHPLETP